MAILKTISWISCNGEQVCKETLVPMDNILFVTDYADGTCLIQVSDKSSVHADIPLKQMHRILKEHDIDPDRDFDTHDPDSPDYFPMQSPKAKSSGGHNRHGKK